MTGPRFLFLPLAIALLFGFAPSAHASQDVELLRASSAMASDGSVRVALDFNGPPPDARIYRSNANLVHVVFVGAKFRKRPELADLHLGEIVRGQFATFAGIGIRLDLAVRDNVRIRAEVIGKTAIVHIPARRSDREAEIIPTSPQPEAASPTLPVTPPTAPPVDGISTAVITLSYADVSEVAGALVKGAVVPSNDVFTATSPFAALASPTNPNEAKPPAYVSIPAATLLPKDTPQGVRFDDHVAVDRRLNAVIVTGSPEQIAAYRAIIAALDVPQRSVLLETEIVELTTTAAHDIGIDYAPGGTSFATATFGSSSQNYPKAGLSISAAISALQETGQAKILARPRIIALNNRPAAILSGEAVPIFNSVIIPGGGSTVVNNQVQYINVGVSLQILPRISANGRVTAQIFCEVSSIIDYVGTTPRIAVRQELTSAVLDDTESLIVGGLLQETEIRNLRKVPSLGNLPLIGQFFRVSSASKQNTNLYIVITPHILNEGRKASTVTMPAAPPSLPTAPTSPPAGAGPGS
jgi:general secretion pathway protein D